VHDPVAALLLCQTANPQHTQVESQKRVKKRQHVGDEHPMFVERHQALAQALVAP
jgi:hypothetical protein